MILFGAGGICVVLLDVLRDINTTVKCIFDDKPRVDNMDGITILPAQELALSSECTSSQIERSKHKMIVAIGNCDQRKNIVDRFPGEWASASHPSAVVSSSVTVGEGSVILQGSVVQARTVIGNHVIINTSASVEHDCTIGNFVHIAPNSTLCGHVVIEDGCDIGAGSVTIPGVTIGRGSIIGAGAVVLSDIPPMSVAVGAPARVIKTRPSQ
jgi:sugar O-acyltransferase (sialic acid O-acetyltransferase NeuD family)